MKPAIFFKAVKKLFPIILLLSMGSAFCQAEFPQVHSQETLLAIRGLVETGTEREIRRALKVFPELVNEKYNQSGDSLLMIAVQNQREAKIIKRLLSSGVDPDAINLNGDSAVIYGARYGTPPKILKMIIEYKASAQKRRARANQKNNTNSRAYDIAPEGSPQRILLAAYLPKGYEPEIQKSEDIFVLAEPEPEPVPEPEIKLGDLPLLQRPLAQIDPDKRRYLFEGISPFEIYEKEENPMPAVVQNPDRRYAQGRTAMHTAAATDDINTMELLLRSGANINLEDDLGWNAIMYAARFAKKRETVSFLLQRGADFRARTNFGTSVLETAAAQNTSGAVMAEFLKAASREEKENAFIVAVGLGRPSEIITAFFKNGVQPDFFHKGKTPLMYAAELNSDTNCIRVLLENGADKSLLSHDYKDAFHFASKNPYMPHDNIYWSLNNSTGKN